MSRRFPFLVNIGPLLLKVDGQSYGAPLVDLAGGSVDGRPHKGRAIRLPGGRALFVLWAVKTPSGPAPQPSENRP